MTVEGVERQECFSTAGKDVYGKRKLAYKSASAQWWHEMGALMMK
jgi:hypothetical protein